LLGETDIELIKFTGIYLHNYEYSYEDLTRSN